jgi:WD40 repeat protein
MVDAGCENGRITRIAIDGHVEIIGDYNSRIHSIAARPESQDVYAAFDGWVAMIHHENTPEEPNTLNVRTMKSVSSLCFVTPDLLAMGSGDLAKPAVGQIVFDDVQKQKSVGQIINETAGVRTMVVHRPTQTLAWATGDRLIRMLPMAKQDFTKIGLDNTAHALAFAEDGLRIAAAIGWVIRWYDVKSKLPVKEWKGHKGRITGLATLPDGSVVSCGWDECIRFWDAAGREQRVLNFGIGKLNALAVAPDGSRFAAGSVTGQVVIWDGE